MTSPDLFADLRIPSDYGRNPRRPRFIEAEVLEDVEPNLVGRERLDVEQVFSGPSGHGSFTSWW